MQYVMFFVFLFFCDIFVPLVEKRKCTILKLHAVVVQGSRRKSDFNDAEAESEENDVPEDFDRFTEDTDEASNDEIFPVPEFIIETGDKLTEDVNESTVDPETGEMVIDYGRSISEDELIQRYIHKKFDSKSSSLGLGLRQYISSASENLTNYDQKTPRGVVSMTDVAFTVPLNISASSDLKR